jgi:hypothetical protein
VTVVRRAGNQIGAEGAVALAAVLPQMASLATLDLGGTSPMHGGVGLVLSFYYFVFASDLGGPSPMHGGVGLVLWAFCMKHALLDVGFFDH